MKRRVVALIILSILATAALAQEKSVSPELASLVEAEREFSRTSAAKGTREAFIANLADDSTLFRPHAVAGKKWMIEQPARPGLLVWQPIFADISRSGDLGYTTGPWEFRKNGSEDKEVAHGHYITLWKKQSDGTWKVVIDTGINNPPPTAKAGDVQSPRATGAASDKKADVESAREKLLSLDREFSKSSAAKGTLGAYLSYMADDIRLFREDAYPFVGKQAVSAALAERKGLLIWQPAKSDVASAADLGYTYGAGKIKKDSDQVEHFNYLRIWKRQSGAWKVVLDVMSPCPPPPAAGR